MSPDEEALADEVDRAVDLSMFCEVRITVRLPDTYADPREWTYAQLMTPEAVRIENPELTMPPLLRRTVHSVITSLRFR